MIWTPVVVGLSLLVSLDALKSYSDIIKTAVEALPQFAQAAIEGFLGTICLKVQFQFVIV